MLADDAAVLAQGEPLTAELRVGLARFAQRLQRIAGASPGVFARDLQGWEAAENRFAVVVVMKHVDHEHRVSAIGGENDFSHQGTDGLSGPRRASAFRSFPSGILLRNCIPPV